MESQITATYRPDNRKQGGGKGLSRREFLGGSAAVAAGTALAACAPKPPEVTEGLPPHQVLYYETPINVGELPVVGLSDTAIEEINKLPLSMHEITIGDRKVKVILGYGPFFEQDNLAVLQLPSPDSLPQNVAAVEISVVEGKGKPGLTIETTIVLTREDIQKIINVNHAVQILVIPSNSWDIPDQSGYDIASVYANVLVYQNVFPHWRIGFRPYERTVIHPQVKISFLDKDGKTIQTQLIALNIPNTTDQGK